MTSLPTMVSPAGEVIQLVSAEHLLQVAGITDLRVADTDQLASFTDDTDHLAAIAREAKGMVSEELVRRLDRRGKWTLHAAGFTITAPSPAAGTVAYDTGLLASALEALLKEDLIDREAADAALEEVTPDPYLKQKPGGIKALLKMGGRVADAIVACGVAGDPPRRTARVKRATP